jgi:hypothetical protein
LPLRTKAARAFDVNFIHLRRAFISERNFSGEMINRFDIFRRRDIFFARYRTGKRLRRPRPSSIRERSTPSRADFSRPRPKIAGRDARPEIPCRR